MPFETETRVVTIAQMKELERKAAEAGLSYEQMMENAGTAAAELIADVLRENQNVVLVFCGKGNNGGDGFVAARKLKEKGADVRIVLTDGAPKTEDAVKNWRLCQTLGLPMSDLRESGRQAAAWAGEAAVLVDAIYGTGFHGSLNVPARQAAELMNRAEAPVFALDIPSGLNGDSGKADADTVRADCTVAFHSRKPAHLLKEAEKYCGKTVCADIGITAEL